MPTTTNSSAAQQTPGKHDRAEACAALKEKAMTDVIPDPKADGCHRHQTLQERLA